LLSKIRSDIKAIYERDPAANNFIEVILCYSGIHAIFFHRIAHWIYNRGLRTLPRLISQVIRFFTGIEIHPGAKIGRGFFIDHGMGVVIGETSEIGDNVTLFQGVTLGGTGKEKGKRHPTIGDDVMIGAGAKILGSIEIGQGVKIGAGSVVLNPVPEYSTVVGVPGRIVAHKGKKIQPENTLDHCDLPDPLGDAICLLERRIENLEQKVTELKIYEKKAKKKTSC